MKSYYKTIGSFLVYVVMLTLLFVAFLGMVSEIRSQNDCVLGPTRILPEKGFMKLSDLDVCEGGWAVNNNVVRYQEDNAVEVWILNEEMCDDRNAVGTSVLIWKDNENNVRWKGSDGYQAAIQHHWTKAVLGGAEEAFPDGIHLYEPNFDGNNVYHYENIGDLKRGEGGWTSNHLERDLMLAHTNPWDNAVYMIPWDNFTTAVWRDSEGEIRHLEINPDDAYKYDRYNYFHD